MNSFVAKAAKGAAAFHRAEDAERELRRQTLVCLIKQRKKTNQQVLPGWVCFLPNSVVTRVSYDRVVAGFSAHICQRPVRRYLRHSHASRDHMICISAFRR